MIAAAITTWGAQLAMALASGGRTQQLCKEPANGSSSWVLLSYAARLAGVAYCWCVSVAAGLACACGMPFAHSLNRMLTY